METDEERQRERRSKERMTRGKRGKHREVTSIKSRTEMDKESKGRNSYRGR